MFYRGFKTAGHKNGENYRKDFAKFFSKLKNYSLKTCPKSKKRQNTLNKKSARVFITLSSLIEFFLILVL